jgi:hypothetical protein
MAGIEDLSPEDQQALRLGAVLLRKNPDVAMRAKRLAKEADSTLRIPEVELEDKITASAKETEKRVDEIEKRQIATDVAQRRATFRAECTNLDLVPEEVEKIVVAEGCSPSTAIKLALAQRQTAEPGAAEVVSGSDGMHSPMELRPDTEFRKLGGNLAALRRHSATIAHDMVNELRGKRRVVAR